MATERTKSNLHMRVTPEIENLIDRLCEELADERQYHVTRTEIITMAVRELARIRLGRNHQKKA